MEGARRKVSSWQPTENSPCFDFGKHTGIQLPVPSPLAHPHHIYDFPLSFMEAASPDASWIHTLLCIFFVPPWLIVDISLHVYMEILAFLVWLSTHLPLYVPRNWHNPWAVRLDRQHLSRGSVYPRSNALHF